MKGIHRAHASTNYVVVQGILFIAFAGHVRFSTSSRIVRACDGNDRCVAG